MNSHIRFKDPGINAIFCSAAGIPKKSLVIAGYLPSEYRSGIDFAHYLATLIDPKTTEGVGFIEGNNPDMPQDDFDVLFVIAPSLTEMSEPQSYRRLYRNLRVTGEASNITTIVVHPVSEQNFSWIDPNWVGCAGADCEADIAVVCYKNQVGVVKQRSVYNHPANKVTELPAVTA